MSTPLDPREILAYLNELGYTNISGHQLKAFIKDLKKLIKYEQRQLQKNKPPLLQNVPDLSEFAKVDSYYYSTSTVATQPKEVKRKENIITVEVKRHKKTKEVATNHPEHETRARLVDDGDKQINVNEKATKTISEETEKVDNKTQKSKSAGKLSGQTKVSSKPVSFIRPRIPLKKTKSDPVTLYQQYQAEWKKIKLPGEDNRSELRWAIREKMMGNNERQKCASAVHSDVLTRRRQE